MAGEAGGDDVAGGQLGEAGPPADVGDVVEARGGGPVVGENGPAGGVALDLPDRVPEAGPLKAELQPADAREQAPDAEVERP